MTNIANDLARILIATDQRGNADLILRNLEDEFADMRASTNADRAAQDFEAYAPDVVVLAFESLAGAQHYYDVLHRQMTVTLPDHRTVILCNRAECAAVVERCKGEEFDDYVLYWPQPYDGFRLAMSIRIACREMAAVRAYRRAPLDLFGQARNVDELDRILDVELGDVDRRAVGLKQSMASTEREIVRAVDEFSGRLNDHTTSGLIEVRDQDTLEREIDQLRDEQIETVRRAGTLEIESMRARARQLKDKLEPSLAGSRAFAEDVRKLRPVVLIVDDDEFARELVGRTLDPQHWEAVFAADGSAAIGQLKRMRPDVILMDIRLPGVDGVSLTHRLKASPHLADIPIIMMTGDARKETLFSSLAAGAAGFVVKPFTRAVLTAKLDKLFPR